jgi:DNA-binding winged helix-turn-helix (wHTH) protein
MCIHITAAFIQWATAIRDEDSLDVKISHLKKTFRHNEYSNHEVMHALASKQRSQT